MNATAKPVVTLERQGGVGVIVIDNPPVNAGSAAVRAGLLAAIEAVRTDPSLGAAVILGAGNTFVAGSDLREFGQPLADPQLPEVIRAIEGCGKPVVAALHGAALGGGLELALGCDARIASPGTVLGLPEVTLGIVPGAGGTQRLPRLVGVARALRMAGTGERVRADAALACGMVDAIAPGDLRAAAVAHARAMAGRKNAVRDMKVSPADEAEVGAAVNEVMKAGKGRPAVRAVVELVQAAATLPFDDALSREREVFQALRVSSEARALRHQFFAEREAGKGATGADVRARRIEHVAVIGAGTMGSGIGLAALGAGLAVTLLEQDAAALARGQSRIKEHYRSRLATGKLKAAEAAACEARLACTTDWSALREADLVIEAVFEDLQVKQDVFRRIDAIAPRGAVLATNTSYLDVDAIAGATSRPEGVVGLHFFSPANVMRLLEIVRGAATSQETLVTARSFAKRLRKMAIVTGNAFGFVGNRIFAAYRRQCEFLLEEGALPEQVDAALEAFGFAMGPFAVADLSGLDIAWRMRQAQAATRDPGARYVRIPDLLCEAGRLGRKTGAGYYRYEALEGKARQPDPAVRELIEAASAAQGRRRREITAQEIQRRALLALANEAARVIAEGVAQCASDIDLALVNGYGFPRWEGGPVFWARERGLAAMQDDLAWLEQLSGPGFERGDAQLLMNGE